MRTLLLVALIAPAIFANPIAEQLVNLTIPADSCGLNKYNPEGLIEPQFYIVGGETAQNNYWPWQVSMMEMGEHACGGTIISNRHILTAAHCFDDGSNIAKYWTIAAGKHSLRKIEPTEKRYKVAKISRHERYSKLTSANDIAVLMLTENITFTDDIQPACMPEGDIGDLVGVETTITGWGTLREGGDISSLLQEVRIPIITSEHCQLKYPEETITEGMFCAGYDAGGKDSCQGDSGGPLVIQQDGRYKVIGVTSWSYGCARRNRPGVNTRVSYYTDWISSKMAL